MRALDTGGAEAEEWTADISGICRALRGGSGTEPARAPGKGDGRQMATDLHAEHVGSLLRQRWLLDARADHRQGRLTDAELRAVEDRAAAENIALQREAGIRIFTDGEVRRTNWMTGILESTGGMNPVPPPR